ncbi:MAG: Hsp20/alpha crystallin family protein [Acidimicrobiales bacterium]
MLMRFDPFRDPFRDLDRFVQQSGTRQRPAMMPLDAYRHGDQFLVHFDLPGIDPESVELTVEQNVLNVAAERTWRPEEGDEVLVNERPQGHYSRQLFLSETLDSDRIEAHYDRGVLTVTIPVAETAKPRKVSITSGEQREAIDAKARSN